MRSYQELSLDERIVIQLRHGQGQSMRSIGHTINRSASTVSRELQRVSGNAQGYQAQAAQHHATRCRHKPRVARKLADPARWAIVDRCLRVGWSPQQIAHTLRHLCPNDPSIHVSHETIYKAIYLIPRGEDRRGKIPDMQSIHVRPPEVQDRLIPGHWEGDLIKGAGNRSSVGTLVERTTGFVVLAKMSSARAADALESFSQALERIPASVRKTLTYDQGREMSYHAALTLRTGVEVFFADPHSPWQRGSNENTNGLLRQYLPKGTNLADYSQDQLNAIALSLNTRPRKRHGWRTPLELYDALIDLDQTPNGTMQ